MPGHHDPLSHLDGAPITAPASVGPVEHLALISSAIRAVAAGCNRCVDALLDQIGSSVEIMTTLTRMRRYTASGIVDDSDTPAALASLWNGMATDPVVRRYIAWSQLNKLCTDALDAVQAERDMR